MPNPNKSHRRGGGAARAPLDDITRPLIPESDFITLDVGDIRRKLHLYDTNQAIKIGVNTLFNALFCAEFLFSRIGWKLTETARFWYNTTYKDWLRDVFRCCYSTGFAAVSFVEHPVYGFEPQVIDIEQVDIKFHRDYLSRTTYILYPHEFRDNFGLPLSAEMREPIPNVLILEMDKPTCDGRLRSRIANLESTMGFNDIMLHAALMAIQARAAPPLITEKEKTPYDPNQVRSAFNTAGSGAPLYTEPGYNQTNPSDQAEYRQEVARMYEDIGLMNSLGTEGLARAEQYARSYMKNQLRSYNQVYLESGRQYVKHTLPEVPTDIIAHLQFQMEQVWLILGVPPSMITSSTSTGGRKGGVSSGNTNVHTTFRESQQQLKLLALKFMKQMHLFMHGQSYVDDYKKTLKPGEKIDENKVQEALDFNIEIPGLPDQDNLNEMYLMGAVKWEKFIECCAAKHGMSIDGFNPKAPLTLQEANGIKEDVDKAQPPKKKTKS